MNKEMDEMEDDTDWMDAMAAGEEKKQEGAISKAERDKLRELGFNSDDDVSDVLPGESKIGRAMRLIQQDCFRVHGCDGLNTLPPWMLEERHKDPETEKMKALLKEETKKMTGKKKADVRVPERAEQLPYQPEVLGAMSIHEVWDYEKKQPVKKCTPGKKAFKLEQSDFPPL